MSKGSLTIIFVILSTLLPTMPSRRRTTAQARRIAEANLRARAGRGKREPSHYLIRTPSDKAKTTGFLRAARGRKYIADLKQ